MKLAGNKLIVYTDVDNTLRDLESNSFEKIIPTIRKLQDRSIPVILCSSKSLSELNFLRNEFSIKCPLIVENGSAVIIPKEYFSCEYIFTHEEKGNNIIQLGIQRVEISKLLKQIQHDNRFGFKIISQMGKGDVMKLTGLREKEIYRMSDRSYSEIIHFPDSTEYLKLVPVIKKQGLNIINEGSLSIVFSATADKGRAVKKLSGIYKREFKRIKSIGVGTVENDILMLSKTDIPFLAKSSDGNWVEASRAMNRLNAAGPDGFNGMAQTITKFICCPIQN
ncbi:MAG: HAD-IIB family hydrolase [Melioribacteraceae bacterium]|nr:HAD-IIB family hydrolase [Melioribacteraceae bacterium]